ncbi:hypothetical protein ACFQX7_38160 [Luedemannella flava]
MTSVLRRWRPIVAAILVLAVGFLALQQITTSAFDGIEARQVAQDSDRLRIALDGEMRTLQSYAINDAEWDETFYAVAKADTDSFNYEFPRPSWPPWTSTG